VAFNTTSEVPRQLDDIIDKSPRVHGGDKSTTPNTETPAVTRERRLLQIREERGAEVVG